MVATTVSTYTDRITQILPTEFVGAYLALTQVVKNDLQSRQPSLLICLAVSVILIPLFLHRIKGITDMRHSIVVVLSFLIWAYALGDAFQPGSLIPYDLYRPSIGAGLLIVWGLVPVVLNIGEENHAKTLDE